MSKMGQVVIGIVADIGLGVIMHGYMWGIALIILAVVAEVIYLGRP